MNLIQIFEEYGIGLTQRQADQFDAYYELLVEKNKVMNLTRIVEYQDVLEKHFLDSVILVRKMDMSNISCILDVGSGAGFPGIPLKILLPDVKVTMIDSVGKKMNFVKDVIQALSLPGADAVHCRAEELARDPAYRGHFDLCVSRAVANLSTLSEYCLPFVKKGGWFSAYKSEDCDEEVLSAGKAVRILGGDMPEVKKYSLCGMGRAVVLIQKSLETPAIYPRKAGIPSKEPIYTR